MRSADCHVMRPGVMRGLLPGVWVLAFLLWGMPAGSQTLTGADVLIPDATGATGTIDISLAGAIDAVTDYVVTVELTGPGAGAGIKLTGGGAPATDAAALAVTLAESSPLSTDTFLSFGTLNLSLLDGEDLVDGVNLLAIDYEVAPGVTGVFTLTPVVTGLNASGFLTTAGEATPTAFGSDPITITVLPEPAAAAVLAAGLLVAVTRRGRVG